MKCHQCLTTNEKSCYFWQKFTNKQAQPPETNLRIALVGTPNVGKSALFNVLTDNYVVVSNYPGTTVEITQGEMKIGSESFCVIDTPGMYSLVPISEEERVARNLLLTTSIDLIIQVIDGKNIEQMLPLTLELLEAKLPVILALNMMDEVEKLGLRLNENLLEQRLEVPVVSIAATQGLGIKTLKYKIICYVTARGLSSAYRVSDRPNRVATF